MTQLQRLVIAPTQLHDRQLILTPDQHHYLSHVLRLKRGDRFVAMDGQGRSWYAQLLLDDRAELVDLLLAETDLAIAVTLIAALPKGNAFDDVVRQATELGVACIAPVISDRTLLQPSAQKLDRWRKIAQEAAEQSERQIVPTILDPVSFTASLQALDRQTAFYLCVTRQSAPPLLDALEPLPPAIAVAIGPEGGWTEAELAAAIALECRLVSLGSRILRSVTAAIVALSLIAAAVEKSR